MIFLNAKEFDIKIDKDFKIFHDHLDQEFAPNN